MFYFDIINFYHFQIIEIKKENEIAKYCKERELIIARPPVVTITPAEKITKDPSNEELVFECEAIGVPRPKILWLWSGGLVEDGKVSLLIFNYKDLIMFFPGLMMSCNITMTYESQRDDTFSELIKHYASDSQNVMASYIYIYIYAVNFVE